MSPVLVTGGAGYIGSHVALALADAGRAVVVLDDLSTGRRALVPVVTTFVEGNVADQGLVRRLLREHGCREVIHLAGSIINAESFERPLDYYANNFAASRELLAACVAEGVESFVFSSSAGVYGDVDLLPVAETAPPRPLSPYGASKLMTEWMLRDVAARHRLRYAALRYFNVAGADPKGRSGQVGPATHLIKIATEVAVGARPRVTIYGDDYPTLDGTCVRDYVHVSDCAAAHLAVLDHLARGGKSLVLNCGYGRGYSVREVIAAVGRVAGRPLRTAVGPRRSGDPVALVADCRRIGEVLGWRPRFADLNSIIRSALAWERRQRAVSACPANTST